jgi:hypothetical protein
MGLTMPKSESRYASSAYAQAVWSVFADKIYLKAWVALDAAYDGAKGSPSF